MNQPTETIDARDRDRERERDKERVMLALGDVLFASRSME